MTRLLALLFLAGAAAACGDYQPKSERPVPEATEEHIVAPMSVGEFDLTPVLLTPSDIGPDWKTAAALAGAAGPDAAALLEPPPDVAPVALDPGLEDPDAACGHTGLIGLPDGVKVAVVSDTLTSTDEKSGGYVATAAALFPAEENASARFDGYVEVMRRCEAAARAGLDDANAPGGFEWRVDVEELALPSGAFGLRVRSGIRDINLFGTEQIEVVMRRGRVIAGFSYQLFGTDRGVPLDPSALTELIFSRMEALEPVLPDPLPAVPFFSADPRAQGAASAALTTAADYPPEWSVEPEPITTILDSGEVQVSSSGSRLFILSRSPDCTAAELHPRATMLARAGTGMFKVGHDHYVWHSSAAFESVTAAEIAMEHIIAANARCGQENEAQRGPDVDITSKPLQPAVLMAGDHVRARVQVWRHAPSGFGSDESVSTDVSAVLRRGRMLTTVYFTGVGEDPTMVDTVLALVIPRLEAANDALGE